MHVLRATSISTAGKDKPLETWSWHNGIKQQRDSLLVKTKTPRFMALHTNWLSSARTTTKKLPTISLQATTSCSSLHHISHTIPTSTATTVAATQRSTTVTRCPN